MIYLKITENENRKKLDTLVNMIISKMISGNIIDKNDLEELYIECDSNTNTYKIKQYHMTLFLIERLF